MGRSPRSVLLLGLLCGACELPPEHWGWPDASLDASLDSGRDAAAAEDAEAEPDAARPGPLPRVDGLFDDWAGIDPLVLDATGDASGAFDVGRVWARGVGSELVVRFEIGARLNLNAGDAADGTLRLEVGLPDGRLLVIDHRGLEARVDGSAVGWHEIGYEAAPTHSSTEFEARIDLADLGAAFDGDVTIDFSGSDSLPAPQRVQLVEPAAPVERRPAERRPSTSVRLAALNTLESGLLSTRRDAIVRVLSAVQADVICLQEDYDTLPEDLVPIFEEIAADGSAWHVHKVRDNVVASRHPLTPIVGMHDRYAATLVDLPDVGPLVVVGVHLTCCGYDGSVDDALRINEALGIQRTIEAFRDEADPIAASAPVVVMGDWNLVGSREPVDVLEDPERLALTQWLLPDLVGERVMTWSSRRSAFPPGILDLVVHSREGLERRNGFVLDESRLTDPERAALGLEAGDVAASDHRPIVVDFEVRAPR